MPAPSSITKQVRLPLGRAAKYAWKLAHGKVEILDENDALLHHVDISPQDHAHLQAGGKIILIHACGRQFSIGF